MSSDLFDAPHANAQPAQSAPAPQRAPRGPASPMETAVAQAQQVAGQQRSVGLSVGGTLPANTLSMTRDGNTFSNPEACRFVMGVGNEIFYADFSPPVHIRPADFTDRVATGGILLERVEFNFRTGHIEPIFRLGGSLRPDFVSDMVRTQLQNALSSALPARLRRGGYDPLRDPELGTSLQEAAQSLTSMPRAGAPVNLAHVQQPFIRLNVEPPAADLPLAGGRTLRIGENAAMEATAYLRGTAADAPQVDRIEVQLSDLRIVEGDSVIAQVNLRSLTLAPDLSVTQLDYGLAAEDLLTGIARLAAQVQLREGVDLGVRDVNAVRMNGLRAEIDAQLRQQIAASARRAIASSGASIPGLSVPAAALASR